MSETSRLTKCAVVIVGLAMWGVALPVLPEGQAKSAARSPSRTLGATNVIVAQGAASIPVRIPKTVRVWHPWFDPDGPAFDIDSKDDFVAFALVHEDRSTPHFTMLVGGRLPEDGSSERFVSALNLETPGEDVGDFYYEIPRGSYRLHLLTDSPTRLALRLKGLRGHKKLVARERTHYDIKSPPRFPDAGPVRSIYSAGATGTLSSRGVQLQVMWKRDQAHVASHHSLCWYNDAPPDDRIAYLPPCLLADSQAGITWTVVTVGDFLEVGAALRGPVAPGDSGQGAWFLSGAAVTHVGHVAVWWGLD